MVDEVQVDHVVGAVRQVRGARNGKRDVAAHKCEVGSSLHWDLVCDDCHFLLLKSFKSGIRGTTGVE